MFGLSIHTVYLRCTASPVRTAARYLKTQVGTSFRCFPRTQEGTHLPYPQRVCARLPARDCGSFRRSSRRQVPSDSRRSCSCPSSPSCCDRIASKKRKEEKKFKLLLVSLSGSFSTFSPHLFPCHEDAPTATPSPRSCRAPPRQCRPPSGFCPTERNRLTPPRLPPRSQFAIQCRHSTPRPARRQASPTHLVSRIHPSFSVPPPLLRL